MNFNSVFSVWVLLLSIWFNTLLTFSSSLLKYDANESFNNFWDIKFFDQIHLIFLNIFSIPIYYFVVLFHFQLSFIFFILYLFNYFHTLESLKIFIHFTYYHFPIGFINLYFTIFNPLEFKRCGLHGLKYPYYPFTTTL